MASLSKTKHLFGFTSPRTIEKIIPELKILNDNFANKNWKDNQKNFFDKIFNSKFYLGNTYPSDPELAARDRITRAPKSLGFVSLKPVIQLTKAGVDLINEKRLPELFTKQLLKFQLPSPYHTQSKTIDFKVRPYLELLRLIYEIEYISKTEMALFFIQLTNYEKFDTIKNKILDFRTRRKKNRLSSWRTFISKEFEEQIKIIFHDEIESNNLATRENNNDTLSSFLKTKASNMNDYADSFMRYIRSTQLVTMDKNLHLTISKIKIKNVEFLLENTDRNPLNMSLNEYEEYLGDPAKLIILEDNISLIKNKINSLSSNINTDKLSLDESKDLLNTIEISYKEERIRNEINYLKERENIDDILEIFNKIKRREVPDTPLYLEWNIWRAFAALNHAESINGNFITDIDGMPLNTAPGKKPDIEIKYDNFSFIVEVTMSSGHTQFMMEGQSVPRHFGDLVKKVDTNHDTYCIFIAPKIADGTKAFFFNLNKINTEYYGGKTKIIPIELSDFINFLKNGLKNNFNNPNKLKNFLDESITLTINAKNENEWVNDIKEKTQSWAI